MAGTADASVMMWLPSGSKSAGFFGWCGRDTLCAAAQVQWTAGDPDAVVMTRLKNASVIHGLHEETVELQLSIARADVPGRAVSAAAFGADEEVHARLAVKLLPPQVCMPHGALNRQHVPAVRDYQRWEGQWFLHNYCQIGGRVFQSDMLEVGLAEGMAGRPAAY
jgi:hypothetical protein